MSQSSYAWRLALAVLVLASLAIRAWMGSVDLDASRFWDERYALENVAVVLEDGRLHPANAFHPSLAHLPHAALLATARAVCEHTAVCDDPIVRDGRFTPLAYLLSRWLQAVYGALSLVALFWVGRKLFGPAEGLAAAALLAMVPWHVRQSAIYKPDVLLVLLLVVALGAALWVAQRPTWRRYGWAGATVGLATAAKYNGFTAGLPLFLGTLVGAVGGQDRQPRRLLKLAAAAGVALAVFFLLDPHLLTRPEMLERDFGTTLRDYERKGAEAGTSKAALLLHAVTTLVSPSFHGVAIGVAGLLGLALLAGTVARPGLDRVQREGRLMVVGFPVLYAAFYAVATTNPSAHNWLPLTPFTALAAAWLGVAGWRWAAARLPARARRAVGAALLAALLAASIVGSVLYAYPATVPTTLTQAELHVRSSLLPDLENRLVLYQPWDDHRLVLKTGRRNKATIVPVSELEGAPEEALPRMDAAVALEGAFGEGAGELAGRVEYFRPGFLEAWGPPLVTVVHPWRAAGPPVALGGADGVFEVPAAAAPPGALLSFAIVTPPGRDPAALVPVTFAGREIRVFWNRYVGQGHRFVSERVPAPPGEGAPAAEPWRLEMARQDPAVAGQVWVQAWLPPEG